MEYWLMLLVALPGTVVGVLQIYDWVETRRKKPK
jgi:hypothetical protein